MNTISLCRPIPVLPEEINQELILVQMLTLERHLSATNPIFEEDLYMGLLAKLAEIYAQVNRFPVCGRMIHESAIQPFPKLERWERNGR